MSPPQPPLPPYPPPSAGVRVRTFVSRVLWTTIPFLGVGLLGWVPALHVARQRRTTRAWWWFVGLLAGTAGEIVLLSVVPAKGHDNESALAGMYCLVYIVTATVYAWRGCGAVPPRPGPYPGYPGPMWMSATLDGPAPAAPSPTATVPAMLPVPPFQPFAPASAVPPVSPFPAPAAVPDMAAEVQAELRELRGFLGGEDAR